MKVARRSFLGVVVVVLLFTIFFTLHTLAASQVTPKTSINSLSPATSIQEKVVNADGGVYWRSDPDWKTPLTMAQQGVYTGDTVALACYTRGSTVPPNNNNPLWYWAEKIVSGQGQSSGWVNDHFLNTGTNQPNIPVAGVIPCPLYPYVWSTTGIAYVRALPAENSAYYEPVLYNPYSLPQLGCWVDGGWAQGNYWTNRWFYLPMPGQGYDNISSFINASLVANQLTLPQCDSGIEPSGGTVALAQGPLVSNGIYRYAITLSGFPANTSFSVECYDSEHPSGFSQFTMTTNSNGDDSVQSNCDPGAGPDHWVAAGWVTSNHVQWGSGSTSKPQPPAAPNVTLARGPAYAGNVYRYAISLSGFPANTPISVECYDSVSPSGFFHFTMTTDGSGNASIQSECYSGDGPDHWVVAGGVTSNHVQWGGGSTGNPPPPTPIPTTPPPTPIPTTPPPPTPIPPPPTWAETAGGIAHTWTNYQNAGGYQGQSVAQYQTIQIACKIAGFVVADGNPWWYRIAQTPWNNTYYVSADAFYNNGATSGSLLGTPWVDPAVPNC